MRKRFQTRIIKRHSHRFLSRPSEPRAPLSQCRIPCRTIGARDQVRPQRRPETWTPPHSSEIQASLSVVMGIRPRASTPSHTSHESITNFVGSSVTSRVANYRAAANRVRLCRSLSTGKRAAYLDMITAVFSFVAAVAGCCLGAEFARGVAYEMRQKTPHPKIRTRSTWSLSKIEASSTSTL